MELVNTEVIDGVTYKLFIEQDDQPVRGNAMASGDDALDREVENGILARLESGDTWAWAGVKCEASVEIEGHTFKGDDFLGACSYTDTAEFVKPLTDEDKGKNVGSYYDDMKDAALNQLLTTLHAADKRADAIRAFLATRSTEE